MSNNTSTSPDLATQNSRGTNDTSPPESQQNKESKTSKVKRAGNFSLWSIVNGFGGMWSEPPPGDEKHKQKAIEKFERKEREKEAKRKAKKRIVIA